MPVYVAVLLFLQIILIANGHADTSEKPRNGEHQARDYQYLSLLYTFCVHVGKLQVTSDHPLLLASRNDDYSVVAPLASIQLTCTHVGRPLPPHTTIQWWEEAPVVNSPRREVLITQNCGLTLRLHNVSLSDYGRYTCKCVQTPLVTNEGIQFPLPLDRDWEEIRIPEKSVVILPSYSKSFPTRLVDFMLY